MTHSLSSWGTHLGVPSSFSPMLFQKIRIFGKPFCAQILQKELLLVLFSLFSTHSHLFATGTILTIQISSFLIKIPSSLSSTTTLAGLSRPYLLATYQNRNYDCKTYLSTKESMCNLFHPSQFISRFRSRRYINTTRMSYL